MRGSPADIAAEIGRRRAALPGALRSAEMETIKKAQETARRLSTGGYKTAALTAMGHPYSKRKPNPPADPGIINLQSEDLYRGWRRKTGNWSGGTLFSYVFNTSAHAVLIEAGGTSASLQIARPLVEKVKRTIRVGRIRRLRAAIRKVL
jgi:hypothetical protein